MVVTDSWLYRSIAERRQSYQHYSREAGAYSQAIAAGQLQVDDTNNVTAGASTSGFHLQAAYEKSRAMWDAQGFAAANSRADLMSKLDGAIGDSGKQVKLDL